MGFSHPFAEDFVNGTEDGGQAQLSADFPDSATSSPPPSSCCSGADYIEHEVSRMDTLAGIAIKYGVEISDIKRMNNLVTDRQMFAHKSLQIPLRGRHMPSPVRSNGSDQNISREKTPDYQQNDGYIDATKSLKFKSSEQNTSLAMSSLQKYYGLAPQKGELKNGSTEMACYSTGSFQRIGSEPFPPVSPASKSSAVPAYGFQSQNCQFSENGHGVVPSKSNGAKKIKNESVRRRQKVEADLLSSLTETQEDAAALPVKNGKSMFPRPVSGVRLDMDTGFQDSFLNGNIFVNGFHSVRKSLSTPCFAEQENGNSLWSASNWNINPEAIARPFLDGLPKPITAWRNKTALD